MELAEDKHGCRVIRVVTTVNTAPCGYHITNETFEDMSSEDMGHRGYFLFLNLNLKLDS